MNEERSNSRARWVVVIVILVVLVLLLLAKCADRAEPTLPETDKHESGIAAVQPPVFSGELRVVSTDGSYLHEVVVKNAEGETVATGDTTNPFPVPEGTFTVHVQGHAFPVTVDRDATVSVSVQEIVGLGKLSMPAPAGHPYPFIVPIVVTDIEGNKIAEGRSGSAIDLLPGTYLATQEDRTVQVEIRKGETTRVEP